MKRHQTLYSILAAGLLPMAALAADKPAESFTYATYQVCDLDKQERADEIFEQLDKPLWDAAVAKGTVSAYGYNAHHTGGRWRRVQYFMAPSIAALFDAQKSIGEAADAKNKALSDEYSSICGQHDDYIWRRIAGQVGTVKPGPVSITTYYVCDSRENQADAIMKMSQAPLLDKLVAEGKLQTWGWMEHIVGAQFRRMATLSAKDLGTLMEAREAIIAAQEDDALGATFGEICDSHADYIWDVKFSKP